MAVLIIYFPVTAAFLDGLRRTEPGWLELARTMDARPWAILCHIRVPAALPALTSGLRVAAAVAPIGAIDRRVGRLQRRARLPHAARQRPDAGRPDVRRPDRPGRDGLALCGWPSTALAAPWSAGSPRTSTTACKESPDGARPQPPSRARHDADGRAGPAADKLTVILDWFVNPDHGPLIVARERASSAEGLEVELIAPADPNDPPKLVAARQADLAVSYQPQLHLQVAQGLPLVRVGTLVATPLNSLVVLADGPVRSVADLKGRKIGFSVGGFEDALLGAMLERHGLALGDVELVNVNFSLSPALLVGQVDAVIGAFRNFELNQMDIVGRRRPRLLPRRRKGCRPMTS